MKRRAFPADACFEQAEANLELVAQGGKIREPTDETQQAVLLLGIAAACWTGAGYLALLVESMVVPDEEDLH